MNELQLLITCCKTNPSKEDVAFIRVQLSADNSPLPHSLSQLAHAHGIFPLFYQSLKTHAADLVPEETLEALKQQYMAIVQRNMLMTAELLRIMKLLQENDIEALAFKGPALAQMAYGDITLRQYSDLDILIHPDVLIEGIQLLQNNAYVATYPLTESQYQAFTKISHDYLLTNEKNNILVELHWRLFSSEFMVDINDIDFFTNTSSVNIQGKQLKTFGLEELIIYLAVHGAKHQWERLEWLLDIAMIIEKQPIEWKRLIELTYLTKSEKIIFSTLYLCRNILDSKLPETIATLLNNKENLALSKKLEMHFYSHFNDPIKRNVKTKTISLIQYQLLSGFKNKLLFVTSLIKPTQLDYLSIQLPESLTFLYYFVRPINIIKRWKGKIFSHSNNE